MLPYRDPGAGSTNTPSYTQHACFVPPISFCLLFFGLRVFALRFHRVTTHTGNHAFSPRFFPNPPMHANLRYFAPLPTHSDLCLSADRCTGNRMHTHLHRTPQPNTFPSFTSKNTSRMVREPHRTHGNKTRISSFTDSRTTICALCHTPTPMSTLSPLVFRCPFHTVPQNNHYLQRASPRSYVSRRHPGPMYVTLTPFTT